MKMGTLSETIEHLKNAIDRNRTDIICTVISTWQKSTTDSDLLQHCLDEPHVEDGTLLHYATKLERHDIVRTLLASGADPCVPDSQGRLPLDLATESLRSVYHEELLQATARSNVGRVCQLLAAGVDINLSDSEQTQNTPLHWAVCYGSRDIVQCLASRGADLDRVNAAGHTPLHEAIVRGDRGIVEELLLGGATLPQDSGDGPNSVQSLLELAAGNDEIVQLLKSPPKHVQTLPAPLQLRNHILDSRRNLVHFDSTASVESLAEGEGENGVSETSDTNSSAPQLLSPTFKKRPALYGELTVSPLKPVLTEERLNLLWPQPRSIVQGGGKPFVVTGNLAVLVAGGPGCSHSEILSVWETRRPCFESLRVDVALDVLTSVNTCDSPHVVCHVNRRLCPATAAYKLTVTPKQLKIMCGSIESLQYALSTLLQLLVLYQMEEDISVPTLLIDDWPELSYRGILLDFSQGRIPNMETLKEVLNRLSLLKINHIYLYTRFLAKQSHDWQFCYSRSDLLELDMFCNVRGLQLIPVLDIAHKVQFEDVSSLYATFQDYVTCFSNAEFVSIGPRLSSFVLDTSDESVLVDDSSRFLPLACARTLQLCSYPLHDLSTGLLQQLPPHVVFNEYGVEADHDFSQFCSPMADLGINFFVCPGTAAWNSLAGCPEAALKNIYNATRSANCQGALGLVACNWTGRGHMVHLPFCWPGFLVAAGLGWNSDCHWDFLVASLPDLLNEHVFSDEEQVLGQTVVELGRAETYLLRSSTHHADDCHSLTGEQGSLLFRFLLHPDDVSLEHLTADHIQRCMRHIKKCQAVLSSATPQCAQSSEIIQELQLTCDIMCFAAKVAKSLVMSGRKPNHRETGYDVVNFGIANLTPTTRTDLANRLLELREVYDELWDQRYLPHRGKHDSLNLLQNLLNLLVPGQAADNLTNSATVS